MTTPYFGVLSAGYATAVAARTTELTKVYGEGDTQVVALDAVSVELPDPTADNVLERMKGFDAKGRTS